MKKKTKTSAQASWYIKHFDDYHDIEDDDEYRAIELGCFPTNGYSYFRYFGLFYRGRRPSFKAIKEALSKKIDFDSLLNSEYNCFSSKDEVLKDIKSTYGKSL